MSRKVYDLTAENINNLVEDIREFLTGRKIAGRDVLKTVLLLEEALLRCRDRFGEDQAVSADFTGLAGAKVRLRLESEQYDPLHDDEEDNIMHSAFLQTLLDAESALTSHRYRKGGNEIIVMARKERKALKIPGGAVSVAVISAIAAALLTKNLPAGAISFLTDDLAQPLFSSIMGLIVMVMGPLIFVSVVSGICALNDIATLSAIGLKAIRRFLVITLLMITFSVIVSLLFFPGISLSGKGAIDVSDLILLLLDLIPQDLVSPFTENKTIQIIVIAMAVGIALLILDEKTAKIRDLVSEANQLIFTIMDFVSKLIPPAVFLSIYKTVALNSISDLLSVWKLVLANYAIMIPCTVFMVLYVCLRRNINIRSFLHDISGPAAVGFATASGTLAMSKQFETAGNVMKIDEKLIRFWVPLSHAMFSPSVIPALVSAAFYAGSCCGTPISLAQILILYILVTQLSIASPKVPGGIMATYTILLAQLGMSTDIIGLLMVANIFVVNAETGMAMLIRSAELEEFSHLVGSDEASAL